MKKAHLLTLSAFVLTNTIFATMAPPKSGPHQGALSQTNANAPVCKDGKCENARTETKNSKADSVAAISVADLTDITHELDDAKSIERQMEKTPKDKYVLKEVGKKGCPYCDNFTAAAKQIGRNYKDYFGSIIQLTNTSDVGKELSEEIGGGYPKFQILKWDEKTKKWTPLKTFNGYDVPTFERNMKDVPKPKSLGKGTL